MFVHDRHKTILDRLMRQPHWEIDDLLREIPISRSTLRRDLVELEQHGRLIRVHGGVMHADYLRGELTFDRRAQEHSPQKVAIARAAASLAAGNTVAYLDAGTTPLEVGRLLIHRTDLRLFTHSIRLLSHAASGKAPLTCLGGEYRAVSDALVGGLTLQWLEHLHFDIAFVGASGLSTAGASTTELSECAVKQAILRRAARRVLVCDSSKWAQSAAVEFAPWKEFHVWVTDAGMPREARHAAKRHGVEVIVAQAEKGYAK
jgi:DeoR/GlpR family transcriptional regulator of sugar metabolism